MIKEKLKKNKFLLPVYDFQNYITQMKKKSTKSQKIKLGTKRKYKILKSKFK